MNRPSSIVVAALWIAGLGLATGAHGAAQRTFVASTGVDTNPCSITSPCRSFAQAATQTNAKGEIIVLDSAGYGPVTITQSLSILAPAGVYAGVSVLSGTGIVINGAGIDVTLRGLAINGQGGSRGILITVAARVQIEDVIVSNLTSHGIEINAPGHVSLTNVQTRQNGGEGVYILPTAPSKATVMIDRLRSEDNGGSGIFVDNDVALAVRDSVLARNGAQGIYVFPDFGEFAAVGIERSTIEDNAEAGVRISGGGIGVVTLSGNAIVHQTNGAFAGVYIPASSGITVITLQNNTIEMNAATVAGGGAMVLSTGR
jgi:hypothetical protein